MRSRHSPGAGYQHHLTLNGRRDSWAVFADVDVHLRAHAEVAKVYARLDGNGDAGDDLAGVARLQAVEVDGVAMHLPPQAVAQPVVEVASETGCVDEVPGGPVQLPALEGAFLPESVLHLRESQVPRADYRVEDPLVAFQYLVAHEGGPGDVSEHRVRPRQAAPQVDQHPVALPDRGRRGWRGFEVGVGRVLVDRDDRPVRDLQPLFHEPGVYELRHLELGDAPRDLPADVVECLPYDDAQRVGGSLVAGKLVGRPALGRELHRVRGRDDVHAQAPDQLHGARVHPGDAGKLRRGRVLHRHPPSPVDHPIKARHHLLAPGVERRRHAEMAEPPLVDVRHQESRLALCRNPKPAGAGDVRDGSDRLPEYRVHAAVVVEEPAVDAAAAHVRLRSREHFVERHAAIVPTSAGGNAAAVW